LGEFSSPDTDIQAQNTEYTQTLPTELGRIIFISDMGSIIFELFLNIIFFFNLKLNAKISVALMRNKDMKSF
jgi:hypothetical protein